MKLLICSIAFVLCITARAEFLSERFSPISTNVVFDGELLVTSDLIALAAREASINPRVFDTGSLYLRNRPTTQPTLQRLAQDPPSGDYANSIALQESILIVKHAAKTHFYRKQGDQWVPDGLIDSSSRFITAAGSVAVNSKYLISGMEVYSWPAREYIQTLTPPNFPGNYTADQVALFDRWPAVISYADGSVWNFVQGENGFSTNAIPINPPDDHARGSFGRQVHYVSGLFLMVSAPYDSEHALNAGAVHLYMRGEPGQWDHIQKITAPSPMSGDQFGFAITSDGFREYISAPTRNETRQQSGAIFIFERPDLGVPIIRRGFREKIVLRDAVDRTHLGTALAVHNGKIYASVAGGVVAFHRPITLRVLSPSNDTFYIDGGLNVHTGTLQSTTTLTEPWTDFPSATYSTGFQFPFNRETKSRFFQLKLRSAFE